MSFGVEQLCTGDHFRHNLGVPYCDLLCFGGVWAQANAREADGDPYEMMLDAHALPGECVLGSRTLCYGALPDMEGRHRFVCGAAIIGVCVEACALRLLRNAMRAELLCIGRRR